MDEIVWQTTLGEIELTISRASFVTWFKNTRFLESDGQTVRIGVPNIFAKQQLETKFSEQITKGLKKNGAHFNKIIYVIDDRTKKSVDGERDNVLRVDAPDNNSAVAKKMSRTGLNPKYTFESFIVGSGNELAKQPFPPHAPGIEPAASVEP